MAHYYFQGDVPMREKRINHKPGDLSEFIEAIIDQARQDIPAELDGFDLDDNKLNTYLTESELLMRRGVMLATKKFKTGTVANNLFWNIKETVANNLFWNIKETVDPIAKNLEYEGQQFVLRYSSNNVRCNEFYIDEGTGREFEL